MEEIRISKLQVVLAEGLNPHLVVVKARASVLSWVPWPAHHLASASPLPVGSWDGQQYSCSFREPLRVTLPLGCRNVRVQLRDASGTVASFKATTKDTISTNCSRPGVLYYTVGPVAAEGGTTGPRETDMYSSVTEPRDGLASEHDELAARAEYFDAQEYLDMDCGDTDPSAVPPSDDDELSARDEYFDAHEYLGTSGQGDDLPHQAEHYYRRTRDSDRPADDFGNLLDDLPDDLSDDSLDDLSDGSSDDVPDDSVSHINGVLSSDESGKAPLTEDMMRRLAERMYESGCLMPQSDQPSRTYECVVLFLVVAALGGLLVYQWIHDAFLQPPLDLEEPLIDL